MQLWCRSGCGAFQEEFERLVSLSADKNHLVFGE
jgi:hypothetical protein